MDVFTLFSLSFLHWFSFRSNDVCPEKIDAPPITLQTFSHPTNTMDMSLITMRPPWGYHSDGEALIWGYGAPSHSGSDLPWRPLLEDVHEQPEDMAATATQDVTLCRRILDLDLDLETKIGGTKGWCFVGGVPLGCLRVRERWIEGNSKTYL